jgi:hypothetical protein
MSHERFNKCAPKSPRCPSCAQVMRLARITSRFEDLSDLYTFECRTCGVSHIEAPPPVVNLEAEGNQSSEKASSPMLFSKLDVFEGSQLFRACRKRLRMLH